MRENDTSKRGAVLEALRTRMAAISKAEGYWTDVAQARTYAAHKLALGTVMPAIGIIPTADTRTRALICAEDEYRMTVEIIGVIRVATEADEWREQCHRFAGDVQQALSNDRQLGGAAVFIEVDDVEIADSYTGGGQGVLAGFAVTASIVYRISVADVSV